MFCVLRAPGTNPSIVSINAPAKAPPIASSSMESPMAALGAICLRMFTSFNHPAATSCIASDPPETPIEASLEFCTLFVKESSATGSFNIDFLIGLNSRMIGSASVAPIAPALYLPVA